MKKMSKVFSVALATLMLSSVTALASGHVPYKDTIVYDENNKVDAQYYEDMQRQLISEFQNSVSMAIDSNKDSVTVLSRGRRYFHPTIPGDVYVSFSGTSSGLDFALLGHASLVETLGGIWCISSWPGNETRPDGVQYEYNEWSNKTNIYGLRVKAGTAISRAAAVENARNYVNTSPRIPYNWSYLNKFKTSAFYCSQLVWRCWYDAGVNIDRNPFDTVVSPAELTGPQMETIVYVRG